ncbi:NADH:flavorubredoxin reductase NorW [Shewanella sp. Actino-trap-3]|uniref:NADH:flavorubredoxin reductase NorW n=1 Tax=Shewanella sp. Actino-trap-3 TaxID=2058331 RepID=UPI000C31BA22|nr:NADH:flavorubredoxin reductase NorW [Shewanella sp. Actino-trap-3]PKG77901.1 NADH:flavorubredoxin reductase NorW [Shewanella sp. Actino-trap-3]
MSAPIIIIGSGFGSYQLIKTIRRIDQHIPITVFTLDEGHDYNKPDLSHVFSNQQSSADLIRLSAQEFASENNITLHAFTQVDCIDSDQQAVFVKGVAYPYTKLVLATGAKTFVPPMLGNATDKVITLNSLREFETAQLQLQNAQRILVIGAGIIGTEIAMDLNRCGKSVVVVDPSNGLMATMLPDIVASVLQKKMTETGVEFEFGRTISSLNQTGSGICATLSSGKTHIVDCVISAAGLKANVGLAQKSGFKVNNGLVVNQQLQTSVNNVYALGDCAEINGKVMSYLQPIMLSANALAKTLLGQPTDLKLPAMLVKVKTPQMPIQLGGNTVIDVASWQVDIDALGCSVKAYNEQKEIIGFVVTEGHMKNTFPLLRALPANL